MEQLKQLLDLLHGMAHDVESLKAWRDEQTAKIKAEEEEAEATQREFDEFIERRKAEEAKRAADEAALRLMMM